MARPYPISKMQQLFVGEYLKDFNASAAAKRAGYSEKSAHNSGHALLKNINVQLELRKRMQKVDKKLDNKLDADIVDILQELRRIAFADIVDYVDFGPTGFTLKSSTTWGKKSRAIGEVSETVGMAGSSSKFKLYDKLKAIELLGRYHKIFTDRLEITGNDGKPIEVAPPLNNLEKQELERLRLKLLKQKAGK